MSEWSFRGTNLDALGIVTLVSDSLKMPKRRGDNVLVPFRHGRFFTRKYFEQRTLSLGLEIVEDSIAALEAKMDRVKALMGLGSLGTLEQRLEDLSVRNAQAECTGDLNGARTSPVSMRLVLDFTMPDPFFRLNTQTSDTQTIDASPKTYTLNNPGTAEETLPKITLTGPLANTEITNTTNGVSVKYNGTITAGHYVVIDVNPSTGEFTAVTDLAVNVIGNVTHEGNAALLVLESGDNAMSVTDDTHTTGTVKIEFYPPYL